MMVKQGETVDGMLQRASELKNSLADFVLDAEGDLATALEAFSASELSGTQPDMNRRSLVVDRFLTEGKVGNTTPIDLFLQEEVALSESDRHLVKQWRQAFVGLFAIAQVLEDGFELMNWTTAKRYTVKFSSPTEAQKMARLKSGEIILVQIAPVDEATWMFFSPWTSLGKLGKPKMAVAIGNFKQNYKNHLYSDAPELLAEAWESVEKYHRNFSDFFGSDALTMPGYQLNKKFGEFQEFMTKKQLEASGIDPSKSLEELTEEAGVSQEEIAEAAEAMGADAKAVAQFFDNKGKSKMVTPKIDLPAPLKKAEEVTVLTHPRWGQTFLTDYTQFKKLLESENPSADPNAEKWVRRYLENPDVNASVWYRLAQEHAQALETLLQTTLARPDFQLNRDLDSLLAEYNKSIETELPEIASVPIHLHELFQEALREVSQEKSKTKTKKKTAGFQK